MLITRQNLQSLIRETVIIERALATVSDVVKYNPRFREWAEVLIDDFAATVGNMKDIDEKTKERLVRTVTDVVQSALVKVTSSMKPSAYKKLERERAEREYQEQRRKRRPANTFITRSF